MRNWNFWNRLNKGFAGSRLGRWIGQRLLHHLDWVLSALTGNHLTVTRLLGGVTPVWLTAIGAKSGQPRTVPLIGLQDEERIILVASNWGQKHSPAWYYNLRANPTVEVQIAQRKTAYNARLAESDEYPLYWARAVAFYPGYANYKESAGERQIPIFILEPMPKS
jgi:deazaflavin-dependent oxidoreductase (nitroreductase family)